MTQFREWSIEDYRIYLVIGGISIFCWIVLPVFSTIFAADVLVQLNSGLQITGQVLLLGLILPFIQDRFRFFILLVFSAYLTSVAGDILQLQCEIAVQRFHFAWGDNPSCTFSSAI